MRRTATLSGAALLVALLALAGCAGNNHAYRLGREAEKQGRVHTAYEYYYRAVTHDPGNPEFASSLKRVAPTAATFWDAQARIAASKGHYADAWCYSIRCIDI
ncbi:MAG: hypothetical protein ACE5EC_10515, partial [Phycisphaerae bacterium]